MWRTLLIALMMMVAVTGCEDESETDGGATSSGFHESALPRSTTAAPTADVAELSAGNAEFAFDLYPEAVAASGGNTFYSPFSISQALAMMHAGAKGSTEAEMASALRFTLPQNRLHGAFNTLDQELASRGQGAQGHDGQPFQLNVANALWGQSGYPFMSGYLDTLKLNYGAGIHSLGFREEPEPSRKHINKWVANATEQKIPELLPPGIITPATRLVLTNTIYFSAAWEQPFKVEDTIQGDFTNLDGSSKNVDTMKGYVFKGNYVAANGAEAFELNYDGQELSMVVIVPDAGTFANFETGLAWSDIESLISQMRTYDLDLQFPKFTFRSQFKLREALTNLGMTSAFTDADFSGITGGKDLVINEVVHEAFVAVDEAGTEAAAATGVIAVETSAPPVATIRVDRPFIFLIRDIATESVLFVGRVTDL